MRWEGQGAHSREASRPTGIWAEAAAERSRQARRPVLLADIYFYSGWGGGATVDALGCFHEIRELGVIDIDELLRIAVHQGETRPLHPHHDALPPTEGVVH